MPSPKPAKKFRKKQQHFFKAVAQYMSLSYLTKYNGFTLDTW